jgi:hypothetical protein
VNLVNAWVKADIDNIDAQREELLKALYADEQDYLIENYQPKEPQFCRAYTRTYLNLGAHSTQRNEGYHVIVKDKLHKHTPLVKAIQITVDQTKGLFYNIMVAPL